MNHHLISDSKWSRCCRFPVINVYLHITPHTLVLFHDRCRCFVEYAADPCVLRRTDERKSRRISRSVSQSVRPGSGVSHQKPNPRVNPQRSPRGSGTTPALVRIDGFHVTITSSRIALRISCCYSLARALDTHSVLSSSDLGLWVCCGVNAHCTVDGDARRSGGRVLGSARLLKMIEHAN